MDILAFAGETGGGAGTLLGQNASDDAELRVLVQSALALVLTMIKLFSLDQLAITFNGGKDACVVFYIVRAALAKHLLDQGKVVDDVSLSEYLRKIKVLYFEPKQEFPEIVDFMKDMSRRYGFDYTVYKGGYKEGMSELVEQGLKAVFMGVRKGDPYTEDAEHLQPSSAGWPSFLRVNVVLKWDYGHVWRFLRGFDLPYCVLYDQGYTSIGDYNTTVRNRALLKGCSGDECYLPAYQLTDYSLERVNRKKGANESASMIPLWIDSAALVCVGDFLSPVTAQEEGPVALAHELREAGCRVAPVIVLPQEEAMVVQYIKSIPFSTSVLLILCIDDKAQSLASRAVEACHRSPPNFVTQGMPTPAPAGASSPHTRTQPEGSPVTEGVEWVSHAHAQRFRHVVVMGRSFTQLKLAEQKRVVEDVLAGLPKLNMPPGEHWGGSKEQHISGVCESPERVLAVDDTRKAR